MTLSFILNNIRILINRHHIPILFQNNFRIKNKITILLISHLEQNIAVDEYYAFELLNRNICTSSKSTDISAYKIKDIQ